jgi:pimeloyl-ACP methyl ester carboxylesterase
LHLNGVFLKHLFKLGDMIRLVISLKGSFNMSEKVPIIHLQTSGSGQPVVLLHALPLSKTLFDEVQPPPNSQLILADFPGFGESPMMEGEFSFTQLAFGLRKALEGLHCSESITLGGVSMGGYWTMEFLRLFPEHVKRALFIATRANADNDISRQIRLELADSLENSGPDPKAPKPQLLGVTTLDEKPNVIQKFHEALRIANPIAIAKAHRAIAIRRDQTDTLRTLRIPALWMAGMEDLVVRPEEAKRFASLNPNIEWVPFEESGHLIPWEEPLVFQERLNRFVNS